MSIDGSRKSYHYIEGYESSDRACGQRRESRLERSGAKAMATKSFSVSTSSLLLQHTQVKKMNEKVNFGQLSWSTKNNILMNPAMAIGDVHIDEREVLSRRFSLVH